MAITIKNLHSQLPEDQLHEAKGHSTASNNTYLKKNHDGASEWLSESWLQPVLGVVSGSSAPATEVLGDRYILTGASFHANWDTPAQHEIVEFNGTSWIGIAAVDGMRIVDKSDDSVYYFNTAWNQVVHGAGTVTSVGTTGTVNGVTLTGTVTSSGSLTLGGTLAVNNGDWSGTDLAIANGGTGASSAQAGIDALSAVSAATNEHILTKDTSTGNAIWKAAAGGGGGASDLDGLTDAEVGDGSGAEYNVFLSNGATAGATPQHGTLTATTYANVAIGGDALKVLSTGDYNIGIGYAALQANATGNSNIAIGRFALKNVTDHDTIGIGNGAGGSSAGQTYGEAVYIGTSAGAADTVGLNVYVGFQAGNSGTGGWQNTAIGHQSDIASGGSHNQVAIGYNAITDGTNKIKIGNSSMATANIQIDWTIDSDERIKENITDTTLGLSFINDLRPVTFTKKHPSEWDSAILEKRYKSGGGNYDDDKGEVIKDEFDSTSVIDGLIAQEVKETIDSLGVNFSGWSEDTKGKQGVQYAALVVPLIKAVQELSAKVEALENA